MPLRQSPAENISEQELKAAELILLHHREEPGTADRIARWLKLADAALKPESRDDPVRVRKTG